ncbi:MAG: hypothetical protein ACFFAS_17320 [Promethearchaeota archaeon]
MTLKNYSNKDTNTKAVFNKIKNHLDNFPFITLVAKYDHILGPRALFSSFDLQDDNFIKNLLRDALNTKNKFVTINFENFYAQVLKIEIEDETARGKKQLYATILLRHKDYPIIPIFYLKKIEMLFHKLGSNIILQDDIEAFESFYFEIKKIYRDKDEILPLESINLQIRGGINTIQGFCELILEEKRKLGTCSEENIINYVELMLDSCRDIVNALEELFPSSKK